MNNWPESSLPWGPTQRAPRHLEAKAVGKGMRAMPWEDKVGGRGH